MSRQGRWKVGVVYAGDIKKESVMAEQRVVALVQIVRHSHWQQWICKAWDQHNMRYPEADYFTDDKQDAIDTMKAMLRGRQD